MRWRSDWQVDKWGVTPPPERRGVVTPYDVFTRHFGQYRAQSLGVGSARLDSVAHRAFQSICRALACAVQHYTSSQALARCLLSPVEEHFLVGGFIGTVYMSRAVGEGALKLHSNKLHNSEPHDFPAHRPLEYVMLCGAGCDEVFVHRGSPQMAA